MTVYDVIQQHLGSVYSMNKYVATPTWDTMKKRIQALLPQGAQALQLSGRFDVLSLQLYGTAELAWVLMVYNGVMEIGYEEGRQYHRTAEFIIDAHITVNSDLNFIGQNVEVLSGANVLAKKTTDSLGVMNFSLHSDADNEISIVQANNTTLITNNSDVQQDIQVAYVETVYSDYLTEGTLISYPSRQDIDAALQEVQQQAKLVSTSVSRL